MEKPGLLPIIEAQITQWDTWASERAREFIGSVVDLADRTDLRPDTITMLELPCQDLAAMALESLVKATGYSEDYFETRSDCLHMGSPVSGFHLPQYAGALLDVRVSCLSVLDHLEDAALFDSSGHGACAIEEARELIARLSALESVVEARRFADKDLMLRVQTIKSESASRMKKARENRPATHDWAEVERLERQLLGAGKSSRDLAGIIQARTGIPASTYRAWRKKR
ncbi:hypothetical protein [Pseudomonas peli]|uniref:hypothetical protein n=1 Tax=Pseudomonas peli TaxID=592361 RepID=UPI0028666FF1|nr:hypothetical protein [Pseudomonas peli]MDR7025320.1 hypothetical protein [Pseudomonas peli]